MINNLNKDLYEDERIIIYYVDISHDQKFTFKKDLYKQTNK